MIPFDEMIPMCAPSPRSGGERIQGEGLLFRREFLPVFTLQDGYRCMQQGIVRMQTAPLTFDPLPSREGVAKGIPGV